MKTILLTVAVVMLTGCGKATTYELKAIADRCGGIEKVHELWLDLTTTKAYCIDGTRAGEW